MKKALFVIIMILVLVLNSQARSPRPRMTLDEEFQRTYQRVLEMNQTRFKDLKKIPVGVTILVPSRWDERDTEMIELRAPTNGQHDCIYLLVHRYVYGDNVNGWTEGPTSTHGNVAEAKVTDWSGANPNELPSKKSGYLWLLAILPIIPITIGGKKFWERRHNPDSYPPVGKNLDSLEPAAVVAEIQRVFEVNGNKVLEVKRGTLKRSFGPNKIKVRMKFGDNKDRNVWILPNESVCKIKIRNIFGNESYEYCRSACTNGMILDHFELPKGWEFIMNRETLTVTSTETTVTVIPITRSTATEETNPILFPNETSLVENQRRPPRCKKNKHRCRTCKKFNPEYGKKKRICGFKAKPRKLRIA